MNLNHFKIYAVLEKLVATQEFWVAYSGGMDSHVLLHNLTQIRELHPQLKITAIHIHHALSNNADEWEKHCEQICSDLKVNYVSKKIEIAAHLVKKNGIEAIARKLRYAAFIELLPPHAALLTAHHADDQAETVLLQLLRGAGVKGLAGIAPKINLGQGWLLRPLLNFTRHDLMIYAKHHQLHWIEDESNLNLALNRNYVRAKLLPLIKERWLGATKTLNQVAANALDAGELLDVIAAADYAQIANSDRTLEITKLLDLSPAHQRNVVRFWLKQLNLPVPSRLKLNQILKDVVTCRLDAMPLVHWHGVEVRRYLYKLYAMPPLLSLSQAELIWNLQHDLVIPNLGILLATGDSMTVEVRFRKGGEKLRPQGRKENHLLSKLFQEWKVPPWQRERIPLIYRDNQLLVVVGYCVGAGWKGSMPRLVSG